MSGNFAYRPPALVGSPIYSSTTSGSRRGFTLTELIVAISVVGILMSLLICAVQASRESSRRTICANNIRNQIQGLQHFHAEWMHFPPGRNETPVGEYSWCYKILPHLEQQNLYDQFDLNKPWHAAGGNLTAAQQKLAIFRCPTSPDEFAGDTDYGGITGSLMSETIANFDTNNGVMVVVGVARKSPLSLGGIADGASHTIAVAECADREASRGGAWVSGFNCFSHDNGPVNPRNNRNGEIFSWHSRGAYVGFVDGAVRFLPQETNVKIVGAVCTRSGGESNDTF